MPPNSKKELWIEHFHKYICINTDRGVCVCAKDVDVLSKTFYLEAILQID